MLAKNPTGRRSWLTRTVAATIITATASVALTGTALADDVNPSPVVTKVWSFDGCLITVGPVPDAHHSPYWIFGGAKVTNCSKVMPYIAVTVREFYANSAGQIAEVSGVATGHTYSNVVSISNPPVETKPVCGSGLRWQTQAYLQTPDGVSGWMYSPWAYAPGSC